LKQASTRWNMEFTRTLQQFRFLQSAHDHFPFTKYTENGLMTLLVDVDHVLLTGPSLSDIQSVKTYLHDLFTIKDIGDAW
ncbi:UNVERIFIED_CONTAM: hypothetical protein Sindi_0938500, partial [Sesamum indicum]